MMKILIAGIPICGKSTFRRLFKKLLIQLEFLVEDYDADNFDIVRQGDENTLKNLPNTFSPDVIYLIEDVRALTKQALNPLYMYDFVIYIQPTMLGLIKFQLLRAYRWFLSGQFAWDRNTGWQGTGKPRDFANVFPILRELGKNIINSHQWIQEDLNVLHTLPHIVLYSNLKNKKICFTIKADLP